MAGRILIFFAFFTLIGGAACAGQEDDPLGLEQSVCGLKEPFMFWLWSRAAGTPGAGRLAGLHNVEAVTFETKDSRTLRGYRLKPTGADGRAAAPRGYLLVMQGNAILADQIIAEFVPYAAAGFDVYIYDFRGYGRSGGRRRLKAMVSDYAEILASLAAAGYAQGLVYAMSFGGIVFLDGFEIHGRLDRIVVDSSPSRLSDYGCPRQYDPVDHLPADCSRFLFLVGRNDGVVTPGMSQELVETAQRRGAAVLEDETFGHPFMEQAPSAHERRMRAIAGYLLGKARRP